MAEAKWAIYIFKCEVYDNDIWERLWAQHSGVNSHWRCGYDVS